jgi:N-acetylmuramoyl-L-alanine amidase
MRGKRRRKRTKKKIVFLLLLFAIGFFFLCDGSGRLLSMVQGGFYKIVVVDPGHGGIDGGTGDPADLLEKHINLDTGLRLRDALERKNFLVVMTREKDESLEEKSPLNASRYLRDLDARKRIINESGDVFVSIHVNAQPNQPQKRGVQVYYYPTSEESRKLANEIRLAVNRIVYEKSLKTETLKAEMIPNDYYVLRETSIPGVLVEIGFMTNPEDKKLLTKRSYQKKIAEAITEGIWQYFRKQGGS